MGENINTAELQKHTREFQNRQLAILKETLRTTELVNSLNSTQSLRDQIASLHAQILKLEDDIASIKPVS